MTRAVVSLIASLAIGGAAGSAVTHQIMLQVTCSAAAPRTASQEDALKKLFGGPDLPTTGGKGY